MYRYCWLFLLCGLCLAISQSEAQGNPALKNLTAAKYLPENTVFTIGFGNVEGLLNKVGWKELPADFQEMYQKACEEAKNETGYDLLTPEGLRQIGIDPAKPAGFAMLSVNPEMFTFFISVADAKKLQSVISEIAGKEGAKMRIEKLGDVALLYPEVETPDVIFIFRGGYVFVLGDGYQFRQRAVEKAKEFAKVPANASLANSAGFVSTMNGLAFGEDAAFYFNVASLIQLYLSELEERFKAPPQDEWEKSYRKRQEAEYDMVKKFFGPITGVAMGAEVKGNSVQAKCHVAMQQDSLVAKAIRNIQGAPIMYKVIGEPPLFMVNAMVDPKTVIEFIMSAVAADEGEEDVREGKAAVKKEINVDLDTIHSLFTGEVGFAVTGSASAAPEEFLQKMGGVVVARLTKPGEVKAILNRIANHKDIREETGLKMDATGALIVPVPEWKELTISVIGEYLVIASDKTVGQRVTGGSATSLVAKYPNPMLRDFLNMPNPSAVALLDYTLVGFMAVMESSHYYGPGYTRKATDGSESEEYRKTAEKIDELDAQLRELREKKMRRENELVFSITRGLGTTAAIARMEGAGISVYVSHFPTTKTIAALVAQIVGDFMSLEKINSEYYQETWPIQDQMWELQRKLDDLRWNEKPPESPEPPEDPWDEREPPEPPEDSWDDE